MILRRLYIYLASAAALVVVAFGLAGLGVTLLQRRGWAKADIKIKSSCMCQELAMTK